MKLRMTWSLVLLPALLLGASRAASPGDFDEKYLKNRGKPLPGQKTISVDVVDKDLREVMEEIGREVGRNILVAPGVQEQVTLRLRDIPWTDAVRIIAQLTRCEIEERCGVLLLARPACRITIQFNDANVRTVLQLLAAFVGKDIAIAPEVRGRVSLDLRNGRWEENLRRIAAMVGACVVEVGEDLRVLPAKLTAVLVDPRARSLCLINGQVYRIGEAVAPGWSVKAIRSSEVVLEGKDGEALIELASSGR